MSEEVLALMIPITAIFMSLLIPIVYAIVEYRRRKDIVEAHHAERLAAIERGMDIPPLPDSFYQGIQRNKRPRYLLAGLVWFFIGAGIFIALNAVAGGEVAYFGLIPAGVGLAFLIFYLVEGRKEPRDGDAIESSGTATPPER
jgi:hypothetical protein